MTTPGERKPSPFLLASATSSAFVLLISVAFATSATYHPGVFDLLSYHGGARVPNSLVEMCNRIAVQADQPFPKACDPVRFGPKQDLRVGILLCYATIIALSTLQYWFGPAWRIRRRRLRPVDRAAFPVIGAELDRMAADVLGGRRIRFLVDLLNPAVDGLAFGRVGRRYIVLSRGLVGAFEQDRPVFEAVVLHELAHVRNRDLDITSITLVLWRSYFFIVLLPDMVASYYGVTTGGSPVPPGDQVPYASGPALSWLLAAQITGLAALSLLTRNTVLRARELQADARVLQWRPDDAALRRLFAAAGRRRRTLGARRRTHPHARARVVALDDIGPMMRPGLAFTFALGACFSLAMDPATSLTALVRTDKFFWPAELFVFVLVVALGVRALRAAAYAEATGGPAGAFHAELGLALGLAAGWMLAPSRMTDYSPAPFDPGVQLAGLLLLAVIGWLLGMWLRWLAVVWEPGVRRSARAAVVPLALAAVVVLLSARGVYLLQSDIVFAYNRHYPDASNPVALVFLSALLILQDHIASGVWLPATVCLLFVIPLAEIIRVAPDVERPQVPRHGGVGPRVALTVVLAVVMAVLAAAVSNTIMHALLKHAAPDFEGIMGRGAFVGAALATAVACWSRSMPVAKAMVAVLAGGFCYVVFWVWLFEIPMTATLPWDLTMLLFGNVFEAGLVAALVIAGLRRVGAFARDARATTAECAEDHAATAGITWASYASHRRQTG